MSAAIVAASEMAARCAGVIWRPEASISPSSRSHSIEAAADSPAGFKGVAKFGGFLLSFGRPMMSFFLNNLPKQCNIYLACNKYMSFGSFLWM